MTYLSKVGSFNINTAKTAGQTQAITDVGFQPKIVLFWWSGSTATGDSVAGGNYSMGFGAAIDSTHRFAANTWSVDAHAASECYSVQRTSVCIFTFLDYDYDGYMDFQSMDADGFTLVVDRQFTNAGRVSYLALGGTDLTNVYIGTKAMATSTGNYNITGVGFQPDVLITCGVYVDGANSDADIGALMLGMAVGASNQGVISSWELSSQATTDTTAYGYNGEVVAYPGSSAIDYCDSFVSFGADGFTLNHLEGDAAWVYNFICIKGGQYKVHELTTRTDGSDIAEADVGFQPVALLFASANRAVSTQGVPTAHKRLSIGAATATDNRAVQAISDEDNLADTETAYANYDSAVYANILDDAIVGLMDLKSVESTGFTCVMDDTDPSACWVTYLAIGAAAAGGTTHQGSAALIGTSALTTFGFKTARASTAMSGVGSFASNAQKTAMGLAALSGIGTFASNAQKTAMGLAALSGMGTFTGNAQKTALGMASLAGAGQLASNAQMTALALSVLNGIGTLAADSQKTAMASASFSGIGSLSVAGQLVANALIELIGTGTLTAGAYRTILAMTELLGAGSLLSDAQKTALAGAILAGLGTFIADGSISGIQEGEAILAAIGSLSADAQLVALAQTTLSGLGTLSADALKTALAESILAGIGTLIADGSLSGMVEGEAILAAIGALSASAQLSASGAALLEGTGTLSSLAYLTLVALAELLGKGTLAADGTVSSSSVFYDSGTRNILKALARGVRYSTERATLEPDARQSHRADG